VVEHVRAAYDAETVALPWRAGDVLVIDNVLAAHGREPFSGDREVLVAMAAPISHDELRARSEDVINQAGSDRSHTESEGGPFERAAADRRTDLPRGAQP
jgi:hypothetical protein